MRTRIKICGIREASDAEHAVEAGADAIGLVFVNKSARHVSIAQAAEVMNAVGAFVETVALFMNPDDDEGPLGRVFGELGVSAFQLHGRADKATKNLAPMRVISACSFESDRIVKRLKWADRFREEEAHISGLVVDAPDPSGVGGGTGDTFDWSMLREAMDEAEVKLPIILAGGLNPDNVAEAIRVVRPYAVDVSSGVESERGVKDPVKIRDFIAAVNG